MVHLRCWLLLILLLFVTPFTLATKRKSPPDVTSAASTDESVLSIELLDAQLQLAKDEKSSAALKVKNLESMKEPDHALRKQHSRRVNGR